MRRAARLAAAAFALATAPAAAAGIHGRVEVRLELRAPEPRPNVGDLGMSPARDTPDRRRSVVYLESAPRGAFEDPERPKAVMDQRNEAFHPYVLAILAGTSVEFPNNDRTFHNVFSFSKPRRFDLGRYPQGQAKSVRFDKAGVVRLFCEIHSQMSAYILVFAHPYFASTGADGSYRIAGVPPGSYRLAVWTDGEVRETRQVSVPAADADVQADFVVK